MQPTTDKMIRDYCHIRHVNQGVFCLKCTQMINDQLLIPWFILFDLEWADDEC